jgi:hypothetical protein
MQETYNQRRCPACGALGQYVVEMKSSPPAESMSVDRLSPYWSGFFKSKLFFSYARCVNCGILYCPFFPSSPELEHLYSHMPPNLGIVPVDVLRRTHQSYLATIRAHASLTGSYLEIGPDVGLLVQACVAEGHFDHYWLFEPNRDVWPELKQIMQGRRHELVPDMFDYSRVPDGTIRLAVLVQVLDHLLEPASTLKMLREKLSDDGVIAIVTHDESSSLRRMFGRGWPAFSLQHPQLYNRQSMTNLLRSIGLRIQTIEDTKNYFPVSFLLNNLFWAVGLKNLKAPTLGGLSVGLRLGNMITIARR